VYRLPVASKLELFAFEPPAGRRPVMDYIDAQDMQAATLLASSLKAFCDQFPDVQTVSIKPLSGKLWEVRVKDQRGVAHRVIYAVVGGYMVLLHAFTKKTPKTPPDALRLAAKRLKAMTE